MAKKDMSNDAMPSIPPIGEEHGRPVGPPPWANIDSKSLDPELWAESSRGFNGPPPWAIGRAPLYKPKGDAVPEGAEPSWVAAIKPDYTGIRKNFMFLCLLMAIAIVFMELGIAAALVAQGQEVMSDWDVFLIYAIIPSTINLLSVIAGVAVLQYSHLSEKSRNMVPIMCMIVICTMVNSFHVVYGVTLGMFLLPLCMVSVYGLKDMSTHAFWYTVIGLTIAAICRCFVFANFSNVFQPLEILAGYLILVTGYVICRIIIRLLFTQKERLISAVMDARASRKEAQIANQAKSEFLANMSHEIRTPMNAVTGMTEMIMRKTDQPEVREYAEDIQQASNLLLSIINDVLDISKIESGKTEIHESKYELGSLINDSYNMVAARCREKNLTATVKCDPSLPRMLYGDEYHLRQILVNLLSNAVKYTNEGGFELSVSGEENGSILKLQLKVSDTGMGIKPEDLKNIFSKFSRLDLERNRNIEGTGLGLSITKELVGLLHGTITVESEYGVGSTFTVRVPQKIVDRTPIGDIHETYLDLKNDIYEYQQSFEAPEACILVVDDVPINLQVIRRLLDDTKIEVDVALSGLECLKKVEERKYDVILMDHMMPHMDGVETLRQIELNKEGINANTPVIMLTANAMLGAREEYMGVGFVDYLSKPVKGVKLEKMLLMYLPQDKVTLIEGAELQADEALLDQVGGESAGAVLTSAELHDILPELDTATGISYCADDEGFYRSMLKEFATNGRGDLLRSDYENEDWEAYQIDVHSMKSAAKMVGLSGLSDECLQLEQAAKARDVDFIKGNHGALMRHYDEVAKVLANIDA